MGLLNNADVEKGFLPRLSGTLHREALDAADLHASFFPPFLFSKIRYLLQENVKKLFKKRTNPTPAQFTEQDKKNNQNF